MRLFYPAFTSIAFKKKHLCQFLTCTGKIKYLFNVCKLQNYTVLPCLLSVWVKALTCDDCLQSHMSIWRRLKRNGVYDDER